MGPITTGHNVAGSLSRHLPGALDNSGVAAQATFEYLALLRGGYWLESILGTCDGIDAAELDAHLRHCVRQIRRLHEIRAVGSRQGSAHVQQ